MTSHQLLWQTRKEQAGAVGALSGLKWKQSLTVISFVISGRPLGTPAVEYCLESDFGGGLKDAQLRDFFPSEEKKQNKILESWPESQLSQGAW